MAKGDKIYIAHYIEKGYEIGEFQTLLLKEDKGQEGNWKRAKRG
jgi:hypothetical protein